MLKVRLMGTKNDITWFKKIMHRHPKIEVLELSDLYPNKGTDKYYRSYAEVKKRNIGVENADFFSSESETDSFKNTNIGKCV